MKKAFLLVCALATMVAVARYDHTDEAEAYIEPYEIWHVDQEPEPLEVVEYRTTHTPTVPFEPPVPEQPEEPAIIYYDSELPEDMQNIVMDVCKEYDLSPALVIAVIEKESLCNPNAVGDNGQSIGLMQIYEYWHEDRMERLGVTDLFDPEQNIRVGVDILHELFRLNEDVHWALMAYNGGKGYANNHYSQGVVSEYAQWVVDRATELEDKRDAYGMD